MKLRDDDWQELVNGDEGDVRWVVKNRGQENVGSLSVKAVNVIK